MSSGLGESCVLLPVLPCPPHDPLHPSLSTSGASILSVQAKDAQGPSNQKARAWKVQPEAAPSPRDVTSAENFHLAYSCR